MATTRAAAQVLQDRMWARVSEPRVSQQLLEAQLEQVYAGVSSDVTHNLAQPDVQIGPDGRGVYSASSLGYTACRAICISMQHMAPAHILLIWTAARAGADVMMELHWQELAGRQPGAMRTAGNVLDTVMFDALRAFQFVVKHGHTMDDVFDLVLGAMEGVLCSCPDYNMNLNKLRTYMTAQQVRWAEAAVRCHVMDALDSLRVEAIAAYRR